MNLMIDTNHENSGSGSPRIPATGSGGDAAPSRDGTKNEQPGAGAPGKANEELEWARRHIKEEPIPEPVREVFRKTALYDTPPPEDDEFRRSREKMLAKLKQKRPEILYLPFETAFREFVCSLLTRQYREEEELRQQISQLLRQSGELQDNLEKKIVRLDRRLELLEERGRYS